uniref:shootin-1-like n=1 Tax=Fragaria vesca subsp. vesca TaxID=101020 RepID=UPI0005C9842F|nr:PREDICTED: shootin-1-like [Fragaria vesca subsp. vesca]
MHHHTGSSPIIYTMEELKIQGEQLPIIKGFEKTYVRADDEDTTKKYNDMVDEVNKRKDAFKEQHPDAMEEQIMESIQSQQIEVLGTVLKTRRRKEIRGMGRGGERDLSHSSNCSTSCSRPPRVDEQQLQEVQQRYEQRLKKSKDRAQQQLTEVQRRAQQQFQEVQQRALRVDSMYSAVQSQVAALYEHLGMPPPPPPQFPPPPPDASPPHVSPQNNDDLGDNIELDNGRP